MVFCRITVTVKPCYLIKAKSRDKVAMKKLLTLTATLAAFGIPTADAIPTSDDENITATITPLVDTGPAIPGSAAGTLFFSSDYYEDGLYALDTTTGAATHMGISGVDSENVGLSPSPSDDALYGSKWSIFTEINTDGSGYVDIGGVGTEGLAYDGANVYGAINGDFFRVDPTSGENIGDLAAPGGDVEGLAYCPNDGYIYGLAVGGSLYQYDSTTNIWTLVGNAGIDFDQIGLACDTIGNLYAKGEQDSMLYRIDRESAVPTAIGDTGLGKGGGLAYLTGFLGVCDQNGDGKFTLTDVLLYFRSCGCGLRDVVDFYRSCR
jgi:hypothetical protein